MTVVNVDLESAALPVAVTSTARPALDLSIVIPVVLPWRRPSGLPTESAVDPASLVVELQRVMSQAGVAYEILIVRPEPGTRNPEPGSGQAIRHAARLIAAPSRSYGGAMIAGIRAARGDFVLTMDPDVTEPAAVVEQLWAARHAADLVIASRYAPGGRVRLPLVRYLFSRALNLVFSRGLSLYVRDMSSAFRLYNARLLRDLTLHAHGLDILQEILVRAYAEGWRVREIPFAYEPRTPGSSLARIARFGLAYVRTFWSMWKLRNSILSADYDDRAHDSMIPLQRYWQRRRFRFATELLDPGVPVLDVGCGSSRILSALPRGSVGLDLLLRKLRYARRFGRPLVCASGGALPFADAAFRCVLCSQVIEHVPGEVPILAELDRVLAPGGRLVLGTPDYGRWEWRVTEALYKRAAPGAYADEHITHYSRGQLLSLFEAKGYRHEATRYILRGELILAFRKAGTVFPASRAV